MRKADIILCTGGVETICEAIYYKKKVIMIPSKNHYEQYTNCQLFSSNISTINCIYDFNDTQLINNTINNLIDQNIDELLFIKYFTKNVNKRNHKIN